MDIQEFAKEHRVRVKRDGCKDEVIPGKKFCKSASRVEDHSHIYAHSAESFGLCLMFASARRWEAAKRQMSRAGFTIRQNGHTEGVTLFDPTNEEQAKLALRLARIRTRRVMSAERLAALAVSRNKALKRPDPLLNTPSERLETAQPEKPCIGPSESV